MFALASSAKPENLPVSLIERYRNADGPSLKVAIYLMLGNSPDASHIAGDLSLPISTVERALRFWHLAGLLVEEEAVRQPKQEIKKPLRDIRRLSAEESNQLLRNPEVAQLLRETQNLLGRVITPAESARLLTIYQYDELPVGVILMVVAFSEPRAGRNLFGYAERIARSWKEEGIDTIEKAEKHLSLIERRETRYREISLIFGVSDSSFSYREKEYINSWFEELGYDTAFAQEAYERTAAKTVPAVNRILHAWSNKGYTTLRETRTEVSNTSNPVPERRKYGKNDDDNLFEFAEKRARMKRREINS